jgi:putative RNA 2'-phosphotransferase
MSNDNSRFLSLILRHKPETIGLKLDNSGWVEVTQLLLQMNKNGRKIDIEELEFIVRTNNKKRFEFNNDKSKIRASQGHSLGIDLQYESKTPPNILYHGTSIDSVKSINENGLLKLKRDYVHLSNDIETATNVGSRHGKPIIFEVLAGEMYNEGFIFYQSTNGVWLTDHVPAKFLK